MPGTNLALLLLAEQIQSYLLTLKWQIYFRLNYHCISVINGTI